MISQISSVSFLVYTLLCVGSYRGVVPKLGKYYGCKNITACTAYANSPEAAKFQNSIFPPLQMRPPAECRPGRMPPFAGRMPPPPPFPPPLTIIMLSVV